ncbi:hypothetical protein ACBQ04_01625 [Psychrobacter faecalis]
MKINKLYTGIVLAGALMVSGCGSDDDGEYVGGNGGSTVNNELNYTVFEPFSDVVNNQYKMAWGKLDSKISNNGFFQTPSTVVGSSDTAYEDSRNDNLGLEYYVGKNVFFTVPEKFDNEYYKITFLDNDKFKLKVQSGSNIVNSTYDITTLDLTGVGKLPYNAQTGINTDLSYFPDGFNATFPSGSQCYILLETPAQDYYTFYKSDTSNSTTIDEWVADQKRYNIVSNLVDNDLVGQNNELEAARYTDEDGYIIAAVKYNGLVYDADYHQKDVREKEDTNPDIAKVYCDQYNSVAANFLEEQIKINYKK